MTDRPAGTPRYRPLARLGEGGMGTVWRARDTLLDREVALKIPKGAAGSAAAERLRREAEVLARLDHPGVVAALDRGTLPDARPFLVLRIVPGPALDAWAAAQPPGLLPRAWTFRGAVAAVAHAHACGVVHRDLTPANIRVAPDGTVCVLDWGLARVVPVSGAPERSGPGLTRAGSRIGTPAYMSPEQAAGEEVGPEADVWSLGVLLWELLAGRRAYAGRAATEVLAGVLSGPPEDLRAANPAVPEPLAAVARMALQPLARRPPDAGALLAALDAALEAVADPPPPAPPPPWAALAAGGLAVLALGAGVAALWPAPTPDAGPDAVLIEALLGAGEREAAEAAACERLAVDPTDPIARGALLHAVPPLRQVWEAPAPACAIGTEMRWDGGALACADGPEFALYRLGPEGIDEVWRRQEEVHRVVFTGPDTLLALAPRRQNPLRRRVGDGSAIDVATSHLRGSVLEESRAEGIGRGTLGAEAVRERWLAGLGPTGRTGASEATRWTPAEPPRRVIVLADGDELHLRPDAIARVSPDGARDLARVALPPEVGPASRMALSTPERHVVVLTETGQVAVVDLETGRWSPWADVGLRGARNLAVSPDGRHAAGTLDGRGRVWSVEAPGIARHVGRAMAHVAFPDDDHLVLLGTRTAGMWALADAERDTLLHIGQPVKGMVWDELGLLAWGRETAKLAPPDGPARTLPAPLRAATAPGGPGIALARGDGGLELLRPGGTHTVPGACRLVAWPDPDRVACATPEDGPFLIDPETGAVDRSHALPRQRWYSMDGRDGVLALMDWDTRFYELTDDTLVHRTTASWANQAVLTRGGAALLLNGRRALVRRAWRAHPDAAGDEDLVPTGFRVAPIAVDPSGTRVAVALPTGGFRIDPIDGGPPAFIATAGRDRFTSLAWSPDGRQLALGGTDGLVRVHDLTAPRCGAGTADSAGDTPPG